MRWHVIVLERPGRNLQRGARGRAASLAIQPVDRAIGQASGSRGLVRRAGERRDAARVLIQLPAPGAPLGEQQQSDERGPPRHERPGPGDSWGTRLGRAARSEASLPAPFDVAASSRRGRRRDRQDQDRRDEQGANDPSHSSTLLVVRRYPTGISLAGGLTAPFFGPQDRARIPRAENPAPRSPKNASRPGAAPQKRNRLGSQSEIAGM
jgi:hypothetical protein